MTPTPRRCSHVLVRSTLAPRLGRMADSLSLHEEHKELSGHPHAYARDAALAAHRCSALTDAEVAAAHAAHRSTNRATHNWRATVDRGDNPEQPDNDAVNSDTCLPDAANLVQSKFTVVDIHQLVRAVARKLESQLQTHDEHITSMATLLDVQLDTNTRMNLFAEDVAKGSAEEAAGVMHLYYNVDDVFGKLGPSPTISRLCDEVEVLKVNARQTMASDKSRLGTPSTAAEFEASSGPPVSVPCRDTDSNYLEFVPPPPVSLLRYNLVLHDDPFLDRVADFEDSLAESVCDRCDTECASHSSPKRGTEPSDAASAQPGIKSSKTIGTQHETAISCCCTSSSSV